MILRKQFLAHVAQTSPSPMLVEVARAEGSFFYTPEGKRYFDLVAGVSVSNVGHGNPAVVRAVQEQAARYMHVMVYGELVETPAGGVCRQDRVAVARAARKRLFRQLGRRGGRGGFETGETFYPAYGDRLHAPRLPRVDARRR